MTADDSARERARERAAQQADKMETIGRLTGNIAEEFLKLVMAILTRAAAMGQALPVGHPGLARELDGLVDTAQRAAELAHKLLGFSRRKTLDLQPLSLIEYVREVRETLRRTLPASIDISFEADETGGVVEVDPGDVKQILLNLATNARDAMPGGGTLHIEVRRTRLDAADRPLHSWVEPGSYVSLVVSDTGTGMSATTAARVFEPFFTTKPSGIGTGLGMSMVYGLVKQHRGFVHLYSELGQGTTVKVYFPAVHDPRLPERDATAEEILPGGSEAILVVEDDPTMRAAAERLLTNVGYRVLTAANGAEGLERYRVNRSEVDLVLTDMVMPKLGGFELYEAIRRDSRDVKVLFTSGFPAPNFRKSVGGDDGVAFVTKPWTANELLGCVRTLLRA